MNNKYTQKKSDYKEILRTAVNNEMVITIKLKSDRIRKRKCTQTNVYAIYL